MPVYFVVLYNFLICLKQTTLYDVFAFRDITLRLLVVTDRLCATALRSHLQRVGSPIRNYCTVLPLNTE
jgi:hypothetical protein